MSDDRYAADRERYAADLAYEHDLSLPQGRMLAELALHSLDPTFAPKSPGHLADPVVTEAYLSGPLGIHADEHSVERLERFIRGAIDAGWDTAGAHFALAGAAEHRGELERQRAHLEESLARDPGFEPSLLALGFLAFVAGDASGAGALLRTVHDGRADDMRHALSHYPPVPAGVGRNDPCPCGSGAKAKRCCPAVPRHPLPARAFWLWEKAEHWLRRRPQVGRQVEIARGLAGVDDHDDDGEVVIDALHESNFRSLALLDGGMLRGFIDRFGSLLPDDERALAEQWCGGHHTVWRVEETEPGRWLRMVDLASGEVVRAQNGRVSRCTTAGEVVFGAVVPTSDGWLLPDHPICLDPGDGAAMAELVAAGIEPLAVAATVFRGTRSATM